MLVVFTDGEAHDTLPEIVSQAEALKEAGVRLIMVAEGGAMPTRIPIRDSAGTLIEYKQDADGTVIQTQRRDDILRAVVEASEGTLVPSEVADQAGAVRDLVAAMKRSPSCETRTADLVPRAWIPVLAAALLLLAYTLARPGPALVALAGLLLGAGRAQAQRPTEGSRALAAGDPASARRPSSSRRPAGAPPATPPSTTRARRRSTPGGSTWRAARWRRPPSRSTPAPLPRALQPRGRRTARRRGRHQPCGGVPGRGGRPAATGADARAVVGAGQVESRAGHAPQAAAAARGGGGGGGAPQSGGGGGQSQQPPTESKSQGLTQSQAEQILNSMERRERETQAEQQRRLQTGSAGGVKDW